MPKNITPDEDTTAEWPKSLTWQGIPVTIDDPEDWPLAALRAFEQGHEIDAIAHVVGPVVWSRIEHMSARKARDLFEQIAKLAGFSDTGE